MEKFKHEEKLLELITEKSGELFSSILLTDDHGLNPTDLQTKPKFIAHFLEGVQQNGGEIFYPNSIFVFDENIYIYLCKSEPLISSFYCKIYYPIRKKKDVEFFILNLKKLKKNGN
jgi:hypothetical protein